MFKPCCMVAVACVTLSGTAVAGIINVPAATVNGDEVVVAAGSPDQPELRASWQPPSYAPAIPGGPWVPPGGVAAPAGQESGLPNLAITSVQIVAGNGAPIVPTAGKMFWVRVNYSYSNPV